MRKSATRIQIKISDERKAELKDFAGDHFGGNLSAMIKRAIEELMEKNGKEKLQDSRA